MLGNYAFYPPLIIVIKFIAGNKYSCNSICDQDANWTFEIIKRTAKSVWIKDFYSGETVRKAINLYEDIEQIFPLGQYSMAPVLKASNVQVEIKKPNKYEVHHYTMIEGWINCWTEDDKPMTFESQASAQADIDELINDMDGYDPEEFRIYDMELKEYVG